MKKIMVAIMVALSIGAVYAGDDYVPVNVNHSNNVTKIVVQNQPRVVVPVIPTAYVGYVPAPLPVYHHEPPILPSASFYVGRPCVPTAPIHPICPAPRPMGPPHGGHPMGPGGRH